MQIRWFSLTILGVVLFWSKAKSQCGIGQIASDNQEALRLNDGLKLHKSIHVSDLTFEIPIAIHLIEHVDSDPIPIRKVVEVIAETNQKLNRPDTLTVRHEFQEVVGVPGIVLQLLDERGEFRIHHVRTNEITFNDGDSTYVKERMKQTLMGGADPDNPEEVLNIWVCNLDPMVPGHSRISGYAFPPSQDKNWGDLYKRPLYFQGIVVAINQFQNSDVLIHELGHYMGLLHTWGNNIPDANNCSSTDYVDDTPPCTIPTKFCDFQKNTCDMDELPDMVENFMDYTSGTCNKYFTKGQIALAKWNMLNYRNSNCRIVKDTQEREPGLQLMVNPVRSGNLFIHNTSSRHIGRAVAILVYNSRGCLVKRQIVILSSITQVDVSDLKMGYYVLVIPDYYTTTRIRFAKMD